MLREIPQVLRSPFDGFFLDLDGVFADFEGRFFKLTGRQCREVSQRELWKVVMADRNFFYDLELMPNADVLWRYCKQYNPCFLTGLPVKQAFRDQKLRWVSDKFGAEWVCHVVPKRDKQKHSGPNKVLIDDSLENIEQWISKGGLGILHDGDVWKTIDQVEALRLAYNI